MGNNRDSLGDRMKGYELTSRTFLTRRIPVIIRIDGKAFHTFTKGLLKPFDPTLMKIMQETKVVVRLSLGAYMLYMWASR